MSSQKFGKEVRGPPGAVGCSLWSLLRRKAGVVGSGNHSS